MHHINYFLFQINYSSLICLHTQSICSFNETFHVASTLLLWPLTRRMLLLSDQWMYQTVPAVVPTMPMSRVLSKAALTVAPSSIIWCSNTTLAFLKEKGGCIISDFRWSIVVMLRVKGNWVILDFHSLLQHTYIVQHCTVWLLLFTKAKVDYSDIFFNKTKTTKG